MTPPALGHHGIWDALHCDASKLAYRADVEPVMDALVDALQLTKIDSSFKQFEPIGVTGIYLLAESHLSIHTWPEKNYAAIDIFSCQAFDDGRVETILKEMLGAQEIITQSMPRGIITELSGASR